MTVLKALQDLASALANDGIEGDITIELPTSGYIRLCGELSAYVRAPAEPMNGDLRIEGPLPIRVLLPREMREPSPATDEKLVSWATDNADLLRQFKITVHG